jgi:hypothetical protein
MRSFDFLLLESRWGRQGEATNADRADPIGAERRPRL